MNRAKTRLDRLLPFLFFLFVYFLYFSLLSDPYFTDEQDVYYGGYSILKGYDIYRAFLSQHMPFSYYFAAPIALVGARTVFQFRLGAYFLLTCCWECIFLRNRRQVHPAVLFAMPTLYLSLLKTMTIGTTMISDHWQGIGLVIILLELIRYTRTREIPLPCAGMIGLGIALSFGTTFISAYPLFILFLAAAAVQIGYLREETEEAERKRRRSRCLREDLRLVMICLAPFLVLAGWYAVSGNLVNAWQGIYEVISQHYSRYSGGMGSDPLGVVWETVRNWGIYLGNAVRDLPSDPVHSLAALIQAAGFLLFSVLTWKKSRPAAIAAPLAAIYCGIRGFGGFHAMAYSALAACCLSLCMGWGLEKSEQAKRPAIKWTARAEAAVLGLALLMDFGYWGSYNLIYPQLLEKPAARAEERMLEVLTEPGEVVHPCDQPTYCQEVMDLELIPQENCGAISYPYFYDMWGARQMEAIRKQPAVLLYDREEEYDGYLFREYASDFDAYVLANYTRLPMGEDLWVPNSRLEEALARLRAAGYGDRTAFTHPGEDPTDVREYPVGETLTQRFTAEGEHLLAVYFQAARFYGRRRPTLGLRIVDPETGEVLGEGAAGPEEIADGFYSRVPMTAELIPGREYEFHLTVEKTEGRGSVGIFFAEDGRIPLGMEYADR